MTKGSIIEYIYNSFKFEKKVENKKITPIWFVLQILAPLYLKSINLYFKELLELYNKYILSVNNYIKDNSYLISLFYYFNLNICKKLKVHIDYYEQMYLIFNSYRKQSDCYWVESEYDLFKKEISNMYSIIEEKCIESFNTELLNIWNEKIPDIFGHLYFYISEVIHRRMKDNNKEKFKEYFLKLFKSSIFANDYLNEYAKEVNLNDYQAIFIKTQPILEILSLSGLAFIYSELYNDYYYSDVCKKIWNDYLKVKFNGKEEMKEFLKFIINIFSINKNNYYKSNYYSETLHKKIFEEKLNELGLIKERNNIYSNEEIVFPHKSKIIKIIAHESRGFSFYNFEEIFIELYFACFIDSKDLLSGIRRNFYEDLVKEYNEKDD
ncbi:hypothetical protein KAZ01_03560 [Candidatus Gracilibacteria bacterium]|nr:hypothetical protein [Candidatus Gracilibacteria bacterium]